jgi:hypothetical protein
VIVAQNFKALRLDAEAIVLSQCIAYRPFHQADQLNSWALKTSNLTLMEGARIAAHDDGGDFYQPLIVIRNDRSNWSIRGASQKVRSIEPQIPGQIVVLDISRRHCVSGRHSTPWLALCFNPGHSVPRKKDYTIDETIKALKQSAISLGIASR